MKLHYNFHLKLMEVHILNNVKVFHLKGKKPVIINVNFIILFQFNYEPKSTCNISDIMHIIINILFMKFNQNIPLYYIENYPFNINNKRQVSFEERHLHNLTGP